MEKKIGDIIEAFENYRFEDALRQIDQLKKKIQKDSKKKTSLSQKDDRIIHIIKCGSLASTGRLHEANQLFKTYFTDKVISQLPTDQTFLFVSIAQLVYDSKILEHIQQLNKTGKSEIRLQRFMISRRLFSQVSKSFLKQFVSGKKQEDGLAQIFLEYLNQINKNHPIQQDYARDMKIVPHKQLNLKMVELFFMKYLSGINLSELKNKKLRSSIIDLKMRLTINTNKPQQAKKIYLQNFDFIEDHFVYLRSIRDMQQNQIANHLFYIQKCGKIFRKNLQIQKYVPLYDYYNEFLNFVLSQNVTKNFESLFDKISLQNKIENDKLYNFAGIKDQQILTHYYHSILTELFSLTKGQAHEKAKKSDYYKISIKGLLLQLLRIIYEVATKTNHNKKLEEHKLFNELLQIYFMQFSKTLTYLNEMRSYLSFLQKRFVNLSNTELPTVFNKKDDNLIVFINKVKIQAILNVRNFTSLQQIQKWSANCWIYYKKYIVEVEQNKKRQKGEVYLSDEFVTTLSDIVIFFIENYLSEDQKEQVTRQSLLSKLMSILDYTTNSSPYNAYLKLRLIYVCEKLNYFDKQIDTYLSMDIKSVQFQTLGYYIISPILNFNLFTQYENNLTKMIRSYYENQRQTSEYSLKGLKAGTTNQVFQYFSYKKRVQKSFSKMILFYTLFLKHNQQSESQFYLNWILQNLTSYKKDNKKVSFNCDTKTMNNLISSLQYQEKYQKVYNQFYGYLNSVSVFQFATKLKLSQSYLKNVLISKTTQNEKKLQMSLSEVSQQFSILSKAEKIDLYNLQKQFSIIDEYLGKSQGSKLQKKLNFTQRTIFKDFDFFLQLVKLKIVSLKLAFSMSNLLKQTEKDQQKQNSINQQIKRFFNQINEISLYFSFKLSWRQQTKNCWAYRQALLSICNNFNLINEEANKNKKIPKSSKSLISVFYKQLQQNILINVTNIKFCDIIPINKKILNLEIEKPFLDKVHERNQILKRFVSMDQKQAKKYLNK